VQAVAYARMFADNARTLPLRAALTRTFSPEGRCDVCSAVDTAKQAADHANAPASAAKFSGKVPAHPRARRPFCFRSRRRARVARLRLAPRLRRARRTAAPTPRA